MKKKLLLFIIGISVMLISCKKRQEIIILNSNLNGVENMKLDTIFKIDNYKTLGELKKAFYKVNKFGRYKTVELITEYGNYIFNMDCIPDYCLGFYPLKSKNSLFIYKDSIVKDITIGYKLKVADIDSLYSFYKKDVFNYKKEPNLSDSSKHLVLCLQLGDSTSITVAKGILTKLIKSYEKLNNLTKATLPFNISIDYKIPKPPLPLLKDNI